jgi:predicted transcriptional regulator
LNPEIVNEIPTLDPKSAKVIYHDKIALILQIISEMPKMHQSQVAAKAEVSPALCSYYLRDLSNSGLVKSIDTGYKKYYLISESGQRALEMRALFHKR